MNAITIDGNGHHTHEAPPDMVARHEAQQAMAAALQANQIELKERFAALSDGPERATVVGVEAHGSTWYIRALDFPGVSWFAMETARDEYGILDVSDDDAKARLCVALLLCCVVTGPEDFTPYFDRATAFQWVRSTKTKVIEVCGVLATTIIAMNPDLLPKRDESEGRNPSKKASRRQRRRNRSRASSTSPIGTPRSGSASKEFTAAPA